MKVAYIQPNNIMRYPTLSADRSTMHMCIASVGNTDYFEFFEDKARQGHTVIMDNGVWETGKSMDAAELMMLADKYNATEVVVPDTMKDATATLLQLKKFLEMADHPAVPFRRNLMFVPQGKDFNEWLVCYYTALTLYGDRIHSIGIPKWLGRDSEGLDRARLLESSTMQFHSRYQYHLLGLNSLMELDNVMQSTKLVNSIRSVDTSLPFVAAQENYKLLMDLQLYNNLEQTKLRRLPDYFSLGKQSFDMSVMAYNCRIVESLASRRV